jgi:hypothetical protein
MSANDILFRCSSLGKIMTEPRNKSEVLSATCIEELNRIYIEHKYGKKKTIENKYLEKGTLQEESSITLYSMFKKKPFRNNKKRMSNSFITGEWDILDSELTIDIKTSWDIWSFWKNKNSQPDKNYVCQLNGYMDLNGTKAAKIAYCLVSSPESLIEREIKSMWYKLGCPDIESDIYIEMSQEIVSNMTYDEMPVKDRVIEIDVPKDEKLIESIYNRIELCRNYMSQNFQF